MKQFAILIFLIVFAGSTGFSQQFEGGVIGGFNASQVDGDLYKGYHKPGIALGGYVQVNLSRMVYAAMELKFMQKGSRNIDSLATNGQIKYIMRLNYVDLRGAYSLLPIREQPGDPLWYWKSNQFNNLLSTTILYRLDF